MDPFSRLPPEIRIDMLAQISHLSTISQLTQASPAMLAQFITSKRDIFRAWIINLLGVASHDDLLQDALAITHMPPIDSSSASTISHVGQWINKTFPTNFHQLDLGTIDKLYRLFARLIFFAEDYLTKATSPFLPRAYVCLPRITSITGGLYFKGRLVDMRHASFDDLTFSERNRLLRAFVRYELLCKLYTPKIWEIVGPGQYADHVNDLHANLDIWEYESLRCVSEYAQCLYGALFANFTTSWLPDNQPEEDGLIFPDNICFGLREYLSGIDLMRSCRWSAIKLHFRGFDLLTHLLVYSAGERENLEQIGQWFITMAEERWKYPEYNQTVTDHFLAEDRGPKSTASAEFGVRGQLLQGLLGSITRNNAVSYPAIRSIQETLHLKIYRQRAWPFLDDARLYSGTVALSHFPTVEDLNEQERAVKQKFACPAGQRARIRSQRWQDIFSGRSSEDIYHEYAEDEERELKLAADSQSTVPRLFEGPTEGLVAFWRYEGNGEVSE